MPNPRLSTGARLSDEDVQRIAEQILARASEPDAARGDGILSQSRELPPDDEERVDRAVAQLLPRR